MKRTLTDELRDWLKAGGNRIGQVSISPTISGFELRHADDAGRSPLELDRFNQPAAARDVAQFDEHGRFRPLKTAPTLRRGWRIDLPNVAAVREALDYLYPAAIGNLIRLRDGAVAPVALRETLGRQTGIYRVAALMSDSQIGEVIQQTCRDGCLRRIAWTVDGTGSPDRESVASPAPREWPLICLEGCSFWMTRALACCKRSSQSE
jgi:sirohydrochlorin cobaltochelatase